MTGPDAGGHVAVVSLVPEDASTVLFFTRLSAQLPVRVVQYPGKMAAVLGGARAVILVRGLFECRDVIWLARLFGIPRYYFLDDNLMLVRREPSRYGRFYERYTDDGVRAMLKAFSGVLLASESLMQYFEIAGLHDRRMLFPPIASHPIGTADDRERERQLTVAFFGGSHRREAFMRYVFPAVCRLARTTAVRLIAAGLDAEQFPAAPGLRIIVLPYERSYIRGMAGIAAYGVDILVHPSLPADNNAYKNRHVLINAHELGAAAIFSNMPPYDAIASEDVAVICENSEDGWHAALARLASNEDLRRALRTRLAAYCARHFSGDLNVRIIGDMLRAQPAPGALTRRLRSTAAAPTLATWRALRGVGHSLKRPR